MHRTPLAALALTALLTGCTPDGSTPTPSAAAPSGQPIDLARLNGKRIVVDTRVRVDNSAEQRSNQLLKVVGNTIIWYEAYEASSNCVLQGSLYGQTIGLLYTVDKPRQDERLSCEYRKSTGGEGGDAYDEVFPATVRFSSQMTLSGDVIELTGEITTHGERYTHMVDNPGGDYRNTADIKETQSLRLRIGRDNTCQLLALNVTVTKHEHTAYTKMPAIDDTTTTVMRSGGKCVIE